MNKLWLIGGFVLGVLIVSAVAMVVISKRQHSSDQSATVGSSTNVS